MNVTEARAAYNETTGKKEHIPSAEWLKAIFVLPTDENQVLAINKIKQSIVDKANDASIPAPADGIESARICRWLMDDLGYEVNVGYIYYPSYNLRKVRINIARLQKMDHLLSDTYLFQVIYISGWA